MGDPTIRLTFRGGGWVLVMTGIVIMSLIVWAVAPAIFHLTNHAPGDNETIESYEFDLSNLQLERSTVVPSMQHRNMSPVMINPIVLSPDVVQTLNAKQRNPFLVSRDLVVGITIGGETRAYPLHILHVHEIINDVLGGEAIAVLWHWPSGHIAVYSRVVEGEQLQFANSGLSGNGGLLMYGLREQVGGEQLFAALLGNAVTGSPATLKVVPHDVLSWAAWHDMHPESTVVAPDEQLKKRYRKANPELYFHTTTIHFPASPMPNDDINPKTLVIAIETGSGHAVFSIQSLLDRADDDGTVQLQLDQTQVTVTVHNPPLFATVRDADGNIVPSQRALWFAWYGNHPDQKLTTP